MRNVFFLIVLFGHFIGFTASNNLLIGTNFEKEKVSNRLYYKADSFNLYNEINIQKVPQDGWTRCGEDFTKPLNDIGYWLKFHVDCEKSNNYYLENNYPMFDTISVFKLRNNVLCKCEMFYDSKVAFKLDFEEGKHYTVYIYLRKLFAATNVEFSLSDSVNYHKAVGEVKLKNGIFIGLYSFIIMVSLIFGMITWHKGFMFYGVYSLFIFLTVQISNGSITKISIFYFKGINSMGLHYLSLLSFLFLILMVDQLLKIKLLSKKLFNTLRVLFSWFIIILLIKTYYYYFAPNDFNRTLQLVTFVSGVLFPLLFQYICLYSYYKTKSNEALLISIAFLVVTVLFVSYSIIPFHWFKVQDLLPFKWVILTETIFLLFILIKDIYKIKSEKIELQKELILKKEESAQNYMIGQSQERNRLAAQMHDSINIKLSCLKMELSTDDRNSETIRQLDDLNSEIRSISHALSSVTLDRKGIVSAIEEEIFKIEDLFPDLEIEFIYDTAKFHLEKNIAELLYFTCLELLNNEIKHSNAKKIIISLKVQDSSISLKFIDDGIGYKLDQVLKKPKGIGLENIINRAKIINGEFTVTTLNINTVQTFTIPK